MPKHAVANTGVSLVTTAETIVATLGPAFNTNAPSGEGVLVSGVLSVLAGTGTTALTVRVYRGTTTAGTLIGAARTHTLAAAANGQVAYSELDAAAINNTGLQYIVTVAQVGATGNGTVANAVIAAEAVNAFE